MFIYPDVDYFMRKLCTILCNACLTNYRNSELFEGVVSRSNWRRPLEWKSVDFNSLVIVDDILDK